MDVAVATIFYDRLTRICETVCPMLSDHCPVLSVCNIGVMWPNGWMDKDETWHGGGPRPGHIVLDGDPAPPSQRGTAPPQFSANVCCGHMAGWIKMPLGMEVNLGPGDVVLDGVAAPPKRGTAPQFQVHVLWPNC